ncbi:LysR family transcriptional regulator [Bordetella genomosp. 9]|uniref:LysR family transcriptional regulator n=1 Tax=Bordetella genomosp. 9 TaxID=1416803 RepID=A0A1W6Z5W1_9BORD|nr:LysR family transcriptional regulator [Bordetella genomosp. 9]ARP88574.1 LysR family transcriptional regulator [Bordetella genomosp. 9]ARP92540.1 LysR family transcriptional regulator [Bordetella genomosp. 9]
MDWDDARVFLAVYRGGTLRAAAASLQVDQATVGRRLRALEEVLDARLFLRTPRGYVPTRAGEVALSAAEAMERAADQMLRLTQGTDERVSGTVRVATSDTMARFFMMSAIQRVHEAHPDLRVVLTTSTHLSNLTRREADIAVRNVRPDNPDLISRRLARRELGVYASKRYLKQHGEPRRGTAFEGHSVIVYQRAYFGARAETLCGEPYGNARVALEVNSGLMMMEAVTRGMGVGELANYMADTTPNLVRIWPDCREFYDLWLVMHGDLHRTARVRAVADAIIAVFEQADTEQAAASKGRT